MGAAYGTAKSGVGIASMGVMRPELVMKSIVPVIMAGVLGIYGLIIAVIISTGGVGAAAGPGRALAAASRQAGHSSSVAWQPQQQAQSPLMPGPARAVAAAAQSPPASTRCLMALHT